MKKSSKIIWIALSVIIWIGLWTFLAYRLNKPVLLPYPPHNDEIEAEDIAVSDDAEGSDKNEEDEDI